MSGVAEISRGTEIGLSVGEAMAFMRFLPATNNYEALVRLPAGLFLEYVPDDQRMYERGEVLRMPGGLVCKYLFAGDGKIQLDKPPPENSLCRLFRNASRFEWVREEYCSNGFERFYEDPNDPNRTGWYKCIAMNAGDNNTPPPNLPQVWLKLDE